MKNETIEGVCAKLFTPLKISWKINGHYIYLEDVIEPQTRDLTGIVKDESGAGVPGVSVFVEGTTAVL